MGINLFSIFSRLNGCKMRDVTHRFLHFVTGGEGRGNYYSFSTVLFCEMTSCFSKLIFSHRCTISDL